MKPTTDFPFLLDNPRAWRTYLGGRMLDALHGDSNGEDGHFPEEWILSTVAARNAGREQFPEEGISHLRGTDVTLKSVLESDTEGYLGKGAAQPTLGVLTKLIDSAERLTLQVHPDKPTALRLFQSQYGKTECWHILSGHPVNGEEPCIYYGFQPDMTRARWEALFHAQDIPGMLAGMQKYPGASGRHHPDRGRYAPRHRRGLLPRGDPGADGLYDPGGAHDAQRLCRGRQYVPSGAWL